MDPRWLLVIMVIFVVIIFNMFFMFRRAGRSSRRRGASRHYVPPVEARQAVWREKEIARRVQREQDDAYERVKLRNETLKYYEMVKERHAHENTEAALTAAKDKGDWFEDN